MSEYEIELILKKAHTVLGEADDALEARLSPRQCGVYVRGCGNTKKGPAEPGPAAIHSRRNAHQGA
jgi:hypothetical protein